MSARTCSLCRRRHPNALGFRGKICKRCRLEDPVGCVALEKGRMTAEQLRALKTQTRTEIIAWEAEMERRHRA